MSDGEQDLFDEGFEENAAVSELFGQDEANLEDEGVNLEDEGFQDEELQAPSAAPPAASDELSNRRKALLQLARKAQAAEQPGPKKKKQKTDKHADRESSRPQRSKRGQHERSQDQEQQPRVLLEVNEDEIVENDADKNFIDDDGVPEDERYEEDLDALQAAEEAEEVEPGQEEAEPANIVEEVLQRRKRSRRKDGHADVDADIMQLISMMNAVADTDAQAMDARPPRPAIEKLKHLSEVSSTLRQRKYHEPFLDHKGLDAMAAWLRPYNNGTLPNAKVRTELVSLLRVLQLETVHDYVREKLEASELGKIIMFYYKNPNESMPLRSECRDLIQAWSAPIFADNDEETRKQRQRERAHRQRQAADRAERERREKQEQQEAERRRKLNPADAGFRARASVPQPSKMDFVINPGRTMEAERVTASGGGPNKSKQSPIGGRLGKVLQQKKRGAKNRIGGVSVEGRGIRL